MSDQGVTKDDQSDFGEVGGESAILDLKARDPSFFNTPWDPPELGETREDRPTILTVVTKEKLTDLQRAFIRSDATVRPNRIWNGWYDRYNGRYFIDALKEAFVYPEPTKAPKKQKPLMAAMGEGEEDEVKAEFQSEEEEAEGETYAIGEGEKRNPIKMILDALKFVQEKHDELWKLEELDRLCKEYRRKVLEINEAKRNWKMRIVQLQMNWADLLTEELNAKQKQMLKINKKIEDFELMKALVKYERKIIFKQAQKVMKERKKRKILEERKRTKREKEMRRMESKTKESVNISPSSRLEALKQSLFSTLIKDEQLKLNGTLKEVPRGKPGDGARNIGEEEVFGEIEGEIITFESDNEPMQTTEEIIDQEALNPEENEWESLSGEDQEVNEGAEMNVKTSKLEVLMEDDMLLKTGVLLKMFGFKSPEQISMATLKVKNAPNKRNTSNMGIKNGIQKSCKNLNIWNIGKLRDAVQIKRMTDDNGSNVIDIPLYVAVPVEYPNKSVIENNLIRALEMSEEVPDTNPFELALCKTMGQKVFHQYQQRYRTFTFRGDTNLPILRPNNRGHGRNNSQPILVSQLDWVRRTHDAIAELNSSQPGSLNKMELHKKLRLLGYITKNNPKFARVGVLRHCGGHTEFLPELKNFDRKTRSILLSKHKKDIEKLPLSTFNVTDTVTKLFTKLSKPTEADLHVTFRGELTKLEGKTITRILVEENMTEEEKRKRYKGRKWMERKLSQLYVEFNEKKKQITEKGIEGRLLNERHEKSDETCPIFWDLANYLRSILENDGEDSFISVIDIPKSLADLKQLFHNKILEVRPELRNKSNDLNKLLNKWGGSDMCKIDLVSVSNLMWILAEIDELKPCWVEVKETLINSTTCPLCLFLNFLSGKITSVDRGPKTIGSQQRGTDRRSLETEVMSLEAIAAEFRSREQQSIDPAQFPDKNLFHIITTIDDKKRSRTIRLGQDSNSARLFVMRSCSTVIFDLSRSEKEIPWVWSYLKQHMHLIDKKDVRDMSDVEPTRHLILVSNFLSWANSPKQVKMRISEKTFHQRVPHPDYVGNFKLENAVYYIGANYKQFKLRTTIIYSGIPFGEEEDVLVYLFKMAWDNELELPLFGPGKNILPLINIADLKWIIVNTVNERTYPSMIFALNKNDQTLFSVASRIAKAFGSSKVIKFPSPDFNMKFCIPKIINDLLKQNIRYDNVETPYQVRKLWNHAFLKRMKLQKVIKELRETRKLYGKTILLIGPPSKAKSELAIIISKLYNLPLIHKENIFNYFLRATQETGPSKDDWDEDEEDDKVEEEEEELEKDVKDDEEEDDRTKQKKSWDPDGEGKKFLKFMKKLIDGKALNKQRKHLTKLLQRLLQSVFVQSHGYVLVDWPVRKEDAIALYTKVLEDVQNEDELEEPKPMRPPPARPDYVIFVASSEEYLDESNYFLFQDLKLKSFNDMEKDFREYQYYKQMHQSVVDLFEERNTPIYRLTCHDGFEVIGKLVAILGEPLQASGRWIYEMFLLNEVTCNSEVAEIGERKMREVKWLKKRYKHTMKELLAVQRDRNFSVREQLLGNPLKIFRDSERLPSNNNEAVDSNRRGRKDWTVMKNQQKQPPEPSPIWQKMASKNWTATFERAQEYWMK